MLIFSILLLQNLYSMYNRELRYQNTYDKISFSNNDSISCLMENLLMLMPQSIIKTYANNDVNPIIKELFNLPPNCSPTDYWNNKKLWHLVCWTYYNLLHTLPAVVRKWWVDSEHKVSNLVDKLTTKYVSQSLIVQEFQDIKQAKKIDNIMVCAPLDSRWFLSIIHLFFYLGQLVWKPWHTRCVLHDRRNCRGHNHTDGHQPSAGIDQG